MNFRMQIAELLAMSNSVALPPTAADPRPYYLKDLERAAVEKVIPKAAPHSDKISATKNKKHK